MGQGKEHKESRMSEEVVIVETWNGEAKVNWKTAIKNFICNEEESEILPKVNRKSVEVT